MSMIRVRLPDSLHAKIRELAAQDDISINQFIATAVAEKMSALLSVDYLKERATRGERAVFEVSLGAEATNRRNFVHGLYGLGCGRYTLCGSRRAAHRMFKLGAPERE